MGIGILGALAGAGQGYMAGTERNRRADALKVETELRKAQLEEAKRSAELRDEIQRITNDAERLADVQIEANKELTARRSAIPVDTPVASESEVVGTPNAAGVVTTPLPPANEPVAPPAGSAIPVAAAPPAPAPPAQAIRAAPTAEDIRNRAYEQRNMKIAQKLMASGRIKEAQELEKMTKDGSLDAYNKAWIKIGTLAERGRTGEAAQLLGRLYNAAYDDGHDVMITPVAPNKDGQPQFKIDFVNKETGKAVRSETIGVDQMSSAIDALSPEKYITYKMNEKTQARLEKKEEEAAKTAQEREKTRQAEVAARDAESARRHADITGRLDRASKERIAGKSTKDDKEDKRDERNRISDGKAAVTAYFKDADDTTGRTAVAAEVERLVKGGMGGAEAAEEAIRKHEEKGKASSSGADAHVNALTKGKGFFTSEGAHLKKEGHPEIVAALEAEGKLNVGEYRKRLAAEIRAGRIAAPKTREEVAALPSGTVIIGPDGKLSRKN